MPCSAAGAEDADPDSIGSYSPRIGGTSALGVLRASVISMAMQGATAQQIGGGDGGTSLLAAFTMGWVFGVFTRLGCLAVLIVVRWLPWTLAAAPQATVSMPAGPASAGPVQTATGDASHYRRGHEGEGE